VPAAVQSVSDRYVRWAPLLSRIAAPWQDTGSGVFAVATLAVLLGLGPLRTEPGRRLALAARLGGLGALLVDVYLY
jgi:hypothetical protein